MDSPDIRSILEDEDIVNFYNKKMYGVAITQATKKAYQKGAEDILDRVYELGYMPKVCYEELKKELAHKNQSQETDEGVTSIKSPSNPDRTNKKYKINNCIQVDESAKEDFKRVMDWSEEEFLANTIEVKE